MVSEPRSPLQNTVNCELTFEGDTVCQYHRVEEEHRVCVCACCTHSCVLTADMTEQRSHPPKLLQAPSCLIQTTPLTPQPD